MSQCNYCTLDGIKKFAAGIGQKVTVRPIQKATGIKQLPFVTLGYDVFIHPPEVPEENLQARDLREEPGEYFAAWLAAITDHCVCGEP